MQFPSLSFDILLPTAAASLTQMQSFRSGLFYPNIGEMFKRSQFSSSLQEMFRDLQKCPGREHEPK